jgi:hypothetical protein
MKSIIIIGYFNHNNIGDEQYKLSIHYILNKILNENSKEYTITFIDCDECKNHVFDENDIIIIGGGDILNNYFMDEINTLFSKKKNTIIALSVGMPYNEIIFTNKLHIIDYLFLRTHQDMELFSHYFTKDRLFYIPDLSFYLIDYMKSLSVHTDTDTDTDTCTNIDTNTDTRIQKYENFIVKRKEYREYNRNSVEHISYNKNTNVFTLTCNYTQHYHHHYQYHHNHHHYHHHQLKYKYNHKYNVHENKLRQIQNDGYLIIAFCLNRHIYDNKKQQCYDTIVNEFVQIIDVLCQQKIYIILLPFNIQKDNCNIYENDVLFNNDILNQINLKSQSQIYPIHMKSCDVIQTYRYFSYFDLVIPMRFHACLFAINTNTPFYPIYTTKKIQNLLLDINWKHSYQLETDENDIPITMNSNHIIQNIINLLHNRECDRECDCDRDRDRNRNRDHTHNTIQMQLDTILHQFYKKAKKNSLLLTTIIQNIPVHAHIHTHTRAPTHTITNYKDICINNIFTTIKKYMDTNYIDFTKITNQTQKEIIIDIITYYLTNTIDSKYSNGLLVKMFEKNYNYNDEWSWILKDHLLHNKSIYSSNNGLFTINFINQSDNSNTHRSGWNYITNHIAQLNNNNSPLHMDLSIDKTFHWKENTNIALHIIPYTKPWVGFLHHTFDTTFSQYNNVQLLQKKSFLASLPSCKAIFVFSKYLQSQLIQQLHNIGIDHIQVHTIIHPTDLHNVPLFTWNQFLTNTDKKIVHIGGWLRNIFSFYNLIIPHEYKYKNNIYHMKKAILKGKHMDNYFPNTYAAYSNPHHGPSSPLPSPKPNTSYQHQDQDQNNFNKHCNAYIQTIIHPDNIELIDTLNNQEYDLLLASNIVFIHLVDASAVNTVIECIIRNTPIIVNRHPAVVEILGINYPLYYGDQHGNNTNHFQMIQQVYTLTTNLYKIHSAYTHIQKIDKYKFHIKQFLHNLVTVLSV